VFCSRKIAITDRYNKKNHFSVSTIYWDKQERQLHVGAKIKPKGRNKDKIIQIINDNMPKHKVSELYDEWYGITLASDFSIKGFETADPIGFVPIINDYYDFLTDISKKIAAVM
jgi:hypothetical protein